MTLTVTTQDLVWLPEAVIPEELPPNLPLPGTRAFDERVRGREGDLVVVQLRGSANLRASERDSLRTLNLKGLGSFALRMSDDGITRGLIRSVQHIVGVIDLGGVYSKERSKSPAGYEHILYGTSTQPAQLVRDSIGNYFQYESSRRHILLKWNTAEPVAVCLERLEKAFDSPPGKRSIESIAGFTLEPSHAMDVVAAHVRRDGRYVVADGTTGDVVRIVREREQHVNFARVAFEDVTLTWRAPRQKFEDRDLAAAEVGVIGGTDLDISKARWFADATGSETFFANAACEVQVRIHGNLRSYPF